MNRVALAVVACWLLAAVLGAAIAPAEVNLAAALQAPSANAWFGYDSLGRPLHLLLLGGATSAALVAATAVALAAAGGVLAGSGAALAGGRADVLLRMVVDVLLAFPGLLLAIALTAVLGPGRINVIVALAALGWTGFARVARGQTLRLREEAFVDAARALGASRRRILVAHVLPNLGGVLAVQTVFALAGAIVAEASLSFLGLGDPGAASWGALLADGVQFLRDAPHISMAPGLALTTVIFALNRLGDDLADRFRPG